MNIIPRFYFKYTITDAYLLECINWFIDKHTDGCYTWEEIWDTLATTGGEYSSIEDDSIRILIGIGTSDYVVHMDKNNPFIYELSLFEGNVSVKELFRNDVVGPVWFRNMGHYVQKNHSHRKIMHRVDDYIRKRDAQRLSCLKMLKYDIPGIQESILSYLPNDVKIINEDPLTIDYKGQIAICRNSDGKIFINGKNNVKIMNTRNFLAQFDHFTAREIFKFIAIIVGYLAIFCCISKITYRMVGLWAQIIVSVLCIAASFKVIPWCFRIAIK
jgi:hypothetical protein